MEQRHVSIHFLLYINISLLLVGTDSYGLNSHQHHRLPRRARSQKGKLTTELFEDYYKCISKKNAQLQSTTDLNEAVLAFDQQTVVLSCKICLRPDQDPKKYNVEWKHILLISHGAEKPVPFEKKNFELTPERTLVIRKVGVDDAGRYFCYKDTEYEAEYLLDVVINEKHIQVVEGDLVGTKPTPRLIMDFRNLIIFTQWEEWSMCNRCNKRGERRRLGICSVKKSDNKAAVTPNDIPALKHYPLGVPCRSTILPSEIASLPEVASRSSETLIEYCFEPCPTPPPFRNVTDAQGNIIEVVKSGEGYISLSDPEPTLPPFVKRKTIFEEIGKPLVMECPHKEAASASLRWQNKSQILNTLTINQETNGRVVVDFQNRLKIKRLETTDTSLYSCWVDREHIATLKLRVVAKMSDKNIKDYMVWVGVAVTGLAILSVMFHIGRISNKNRLQ